MDTPHVTDLLNAYVLGALEPDEVGLVEAHLETCAACRHQAESARALAQQLLYGIPLVQPPADLKRNVLARVHAVAMAESQMAEAIAPRQPSLNGTPPIAPEVSRRRNLLQRLLDTMMGAEPLRADDPVATLLLQLLAQPNCAVWNVGGTQDAPNANARLVGVPNQRDGVLVTNGLRDLAPDQVYQIWLLHDGKPQPNALFHVAHGGRAQQIVHSPTRLRDFEVVAVTPEPATGSPAPTGPIVLMGTIAA
jgi:anti-sigma-K factor RskA